MRAVLFLFNTLEFAQNAVIAFCHIEVFFAHPLGPAAWTRFAYYLCTIMFYVFTILTVFASINVCTIGPVSLVKEIVRNVIGFMLYVTLSLIIMHKAEQDLSLWEPMDDYEGLGQLPMDTFRKYMRMQSITALCCAITYLMHATIVIDIYLSDEDIDFAFDDSDDDSDPDGYVAIHIYFLGDVVQRHLEQYAWFQEFESGIIRQF
ncbi:hypothetical protein AWZ03_013030 [Drosophila navojoa]|uniref:DUF7775 domain-containing protein n=1 Tax=Drosophila navojoa TaxID=7232 RepID=A0A484AVW2_DRONA|nr:uncharacterized protein LOC115564685 [Drosophila navojoa]TDG40538.1 hypothetical protein AWZ03_013030 [Drosophila navojoa]